jgi:ABC-type multidrug transport system fused ATPase/permease subunit
MSLRPPPWIADRGGWYRHGAWSLASAAAESGIGLWLRELTQPVGKVFWLGVMALLLAARVVLSWRRDLDRERLALETGNAFHRRLWARGSGEGQDPSWLAREGREWIESGTRAALEWRTAAATLLLSVPLLIWLAPWITLAVLAAALLLGRWAREKSRNWKSLADAERDSAERMATGEDWAWRSIPQMRPAGWSPVVARARRRAFRMFLCERMERARRHLAWGAGGEAAAHVAGWFVGAAAVLSWATGRMSAGSLLAFLGISLLAYRPVREAGRLLPHLRRAREVWSALASPPTFHADSDVRAEDLRVAWPHAPSVLSGLDFFVPRGSLVVAHGPNGCGKSTLLAALAGAPLPFSGTATRPRRTFWMAQEPVLPPTSPARWTGIEHPFPGAVDGLLGLLFPDGMPASLDWNADIPDGGHELSRGQRARLCLLAAAARPRSLWLLDEPVSALPPGEGVRILFEVLARRGRATAILAVPDLGPDFAETERLWEPGGERRGPVVSLVEPRT